MEKPVIIFGAKGIGKAAQEIFTSNGVVIFGFLDDDDKLKGSEINDISVLGKTDEGDFLNLLGKKCEAFVALDEVKVRKKQVELLVEEYKSMPVNAIHREAIIPKSVHMGHGNFINARVTIGPGARVANHCILNTGVIVEHDSVLEDFVQIGAGSIINSGVKVESGAFIGSGVTIVSGITIGKNANVGAGSVVVNNVSKNQTVFGNPAKQVSI